MPAELFVGVCRDRNGKTGFKVSRHSNRDDAIREWMDSELRVHHVVEVDATHDDEVPFAVIRGLSMTADGINALDSLLTAVAEYLTALPRVTVRE